MFGQESSDSLAPIRVRYIYHLGAFQFARRRFVSCTMPPPCLSGLLSIDCPGCPSTRPSGSWAPSRCSARAGSAQHQRRHPCSTTMRWLMFLKAANIPSRPPRALCPAAVPPEVGPATTRSRPSRRLSDPGRTCPRLFCSN